MHFIVMCLNWILKIHSQYASKMMTTSKMKITSKWRQSLKWIWLEIEDNLKNDDNLNNKDNLIKWKQPKKRSQPQKRSPSENENEVIVPQRNFFFQMASIIGGKYTTKKYWVALESNPIYLLAAVSWIIILIMMKYISEPNVYKNITIT